MAVHGGVVGLLGHDDLRQLKELVVLSCQEDCQ